MRGCCINLTRAKWMSLKDLQVAATVIWLYSMLRDSHLPWQLTEWNLVGTIVFVKLDTGGGGSFGRRKLRTMMMAEKIFQVPRLSINFDQRTFVNSMFWKKKKEVALQGGGWHYIFQSRQLAHYLTITYECLQEPIHNLVCFYLFYYIYWMRLAEMKSEWNGALRQCIWNLEIGLMVDE